MPEPVTEAKSIKCPVCDVRLPKRDLRAQVAHMEAQVKAGDTAHIDLVLWRQRGLL